ncbi:MAG: hypothetical protein B7Y83_11470 [Flavobacteriales bacterium 32-34-25]|nr:MAG: hypothetical protein B7Y83_11470 [Flavobacteriales bacterium 32-34-25]
MLKIDELAISKIVDFTKQNIKIENYKLDPEFYYQSLPLCVIDSVYSIGVKYEIVRKTVKNFCEYNNISVFRQNIDSIPEQNSQFSVTDFINTFGKTDFEELANSIFKNRQRTSSKSGILKAEAVVLFLNELSNEGINYFQDLENISTSFETKIKQIRGQKSGISLQYFYMLAGNDRLIKPDRMVVRYIESILKVPISIKDCQNILEQTSLKLEEYGFYISPRKLDNAIWNYQRDIK